MTIEELGIVCKMTELINDNYNFFGVCISHISNCKSNKDAIKRLECLFDEIALKPGEQQLLNRIICLLM